MSGSIDEPWEDCTGEGFVCEDEACSPYEPATRQRPYYAQVDDDWSSSMAWWLCEYHYHYGQSGEVNR